MASLLLVAFGIFFLSDLAIGSKENASKGHKRSSVFPSFDELSSGKPETFKIQNTECVFTKHKDECEVVYMASSGLCPLNYVVSQLFSDVDLLATTNSFIVPTKYMVQKIKSNKCAGHKNNGLIIFQADSTESVELVPQQLTLAAEASLTAKWKFDEPVTLEKLDITLNGKTSIGSNHNVPMKVKKSDGSDYELSLTMASLDVNSFFASFGIDTAEMIEPELNAEKRSLGLTALALQNPNIEGVFEPGAGFEIIATGNIVAPKLSADASKFYIFVQDFKKADASVEEEGFAKPIGGIFALYRRTKVPDAIMSLTGVAVPELAIFDGVNQVAITVATKEIFNINSKDLHDIVADYVPIEGLDMIMKGLSIMHYTPNSNQDIKNKQKQMANKVLFRCDITNEKLKWTSPQNIESQLMKFTSLLWKEPKGFTSLRLAPDTKGVFVGIDFVKETKTVQVSFNLTEPKKVLENGLVSLLNTTITLYTDIKRGKDVEGGSNDYKDFKMSGAGSETILDELVDVVVEQTEARTNVKAAANIFNMATLRNRTKAEALPENLHETFSFVSDFPIKELRYEASFEWNKVLKFKGVAMLEDEPKLEVLYFLTNSGPQLKVGLLFRNSYLHEVVNMFYGEERMQSTWMKYKEIAVVIKHKRHPREAFHPFDRTDIADADRSFQDDGIGFIADILDLRGCRRNEWKMCSFLKLHHDRFANFKFHGRMLPRKMEMSTSLSWRVFLGTSFAFGSSSLKVKISASANGDRMVLEGRVHMTLTFESFEGKIYDDGSNKLILQFGGKETDLSTKILNLAYARLQPLRGKSVLPTTESVQQIELNSRLHLGTVQSHQIEFSGGAGRQFIRYLDNLETQVRFVGERSKLQHKKIYDAFGITSENKLLHEAKFEDQVIVAYNSIDETWNVPDFQVKVKKGLHFYGKMTLKTAEAYEATVNLLDNMQIETVLHLTPLRYGKVVTDSDGRVSFRSVNLFLFKSPNRPELGPNLIMNGNDQRMEGHCETIGLEGKFTTELFRRSDQDFDYRVKMRGKVYKETEDVDVILTAKENDKPSELKFKYQLDLSNQATSNVNNKLRDALSDIKTQASKGKEASDEMLRETTELLENYKSQQQGHSTAMESLRDQIQSINSGVDMSVLEISTDCIDKCKTVSMPGIEWKEDCIRQAQGERNMKCMTWTEDKEKVVNVVCLLKCEAKKVAAAGDAAEQMQEMRVLLNRYRETKILSESVGKLVGLAEQANQISANTKQLVESKSEIQEELEELLSGPASRNLVDIAVLKVDEHVETLLPPCLPFQLDFTLNTNSPKSHNGKYKICFNGEFFKNVGIRIVRESYPAVDELFKALEEAELRYARIGAIKKSLTRVVEDIRQASKRGEVPKRKEDLVVKNLMTMATRKIPAFTLKGDKTIMAFSHYSPWATAKRSDPFYMKFSTAGQKKYDMGSLKSQPACQLAENVISEYKNIADGIEKITDHYNNGKDLFGKSKVSILKELTDSHSDLMKLMNRTKLSQIEKTDMMYWYQYTKHGMDDYFNTFFKQLTKQNKRSLEYLRNELTSFYGSDNFFDKLESHGNKAIKRSKIQTAKKERHMTSLKDVGKELKRLLFEEGNTLDEASSVIGNLNEKIKYLRNSAASCY